MRQLIALGFAAIGACCVIFGQSTNTHPRFVAADVHPTTTHEPRRWVLPSSDLRSTLRTLPVPDGIYTATGATMLDLIAAAYGRDPLKVAGGPNWLEIDRFDIAVKVQGETSVEDRRLMLQALLEDRFKLVVREATRPLPGYVLTAGKHPALKRAVGSEKSGCVSDNSPKPTTNTITWTCRNITMKAFAEGLQEMTGVYLSPGPMLDATGLKGSWNFDVHWSQQWLYIPNAPRSHVTIFDALEQQLGLKLEERPVPAPALAVMSVSQIPTPNAPNLTQLLSTRSPVSRFDAASVRPVDPNSRGRQNRRIESSRLTIENFPMRYLFDMALPGQQISNLPPWTELEAYNIVATAPPGLAALNSTNVAIPMLALLRDRFRLAFHTEQRPGPAYLIQTVKPKVTKADPARRASCRRDTAPSGAQGFLTRITCHGVTMGEFADWLSIGTPSLKIGGVSDSTALNGRWDLTLVYDAEPERSLAAVASAGAPEDPAGGYTLFEAMQRQLGLKLVETTKPRPVVVIDHLEKKPTSN